MNSGAATKGGAIQAIYGYGPLGAPIRYWPQGVPRLWSHVGVVAPAQVDFDEPPMVWEARMGHKFGPTPIDEFRERYSRTRVVTYFVPDLEAAIAWLHAHYGMDYGFWTVAGIALGLTGGEARKDTCSEALENCLAAGGLDRWRGDLHRVTPNQSYHNTCGVVA